MLEKKMMSFFVVVVLFFAAFAQESMMVFTGSEALSGKDAWVLELLRYELYALSGTKLKEYNLLETGIFDGRRFPIKTTTYSKSQPFF